MKALANLAILAEHSPVRAMLMEYARAYYHDERDQMRLVDRTFLALPEMLEEVRQDRIEQSLFVVMHRLMQAKHKKAALLHPDDRQIVCDTQDCLPKANHEAVE